MKFENLYLPAMAGVFNTLSEKWQNSIQITLTNSLHNMLGYYYSSNRSKFQWINARSFNDKNNWIDDYFIISAGFLGYGN